MRSLRGRMEVNMRIGHGYDVHKLVENRKLILGGVEIEYKLGLLGHSDADVLTHAVCDALLGAAAEGDIGKHFPDSELQWKGVSSIFLLEKVRDLIAKKGFAVVNIDATIIAQSPKLAPFIPEMITNIAISSGCPQNAVNIKATTEEGLGFTGKGEGIAAHCVCLLKAKEG